MILIDANLLIYSHNVGASQHARARAWLEATMSSPDPVRFAWASILVFLRITTDLRALAHPRPMSDVASIAAEWLARPNVDVLSPTPRHWMILRDLLDRGQVRGPLVSDAHLAALAIEHGVTLCTTDRDFARFPGLKWMNPLE